MSRVASELKLRCPSCDGQDIRHSLPRGILDNVMLLFGRKPFRCRWCERRFYVNPDHAESESSVDAQVEHQ